MNKKNTKTAYVFDPIKINRRLEYAKRRTLEADISEANKALILEYAEYVQDRKKLSKDRVERWYNTLTPLARMLGKDFEKADKADILRLDKKITESDYSPNTKCDFVRMLKCFYKWVKSPDKTTELKYVPEEVACLVAVRPVIEPLRSDQVITWGDAVSMGKQAQNIRDRACIKTLFESCNRVREHLSLTVGDVIEDDGGLMLNTTITKTGRKIFQKPIDLSEADLREWLEVHPKGDDPDAPLWIRIDGRKPLEAMDYFYLRKLLRVLGKKSGVSDKKKVNPHNFRHGALTYYSGFMSDSQVKYMAGWTQGTRMLDTYLHPDLQNIRDAKNKAMGKNVKQAPQEELTKACPHCGKEQDKSRTSCAFCHKFLDLSRSEEIHRIIREEFDRSLKGFVENNPAVGQQYKEFIKSRAKAPQ